MTLEESQELLGSALFSAIMQMPAGHVDEIILTPKGHEALAKHLPRSTFVASRLDNLAGIRISIAH